MVNNVRRLNYTVVIINVVKTLEQLRNSIKQQLYSLSQSEQLTPVKITWKQS